MAVYTNLNEEQVKHFLKRYEIGDLISFSGITEGIENTNFYLKTSNGNYILTIFEKRVEVKDIPFFIKIMLHLNKKGYYCPKPICDKKNNFIQNLNGKPTIIVNFLPGKSKKNFTSRDCYQIGSSMGLMHYYSKDFELERDNSLSIKGWQTLITNCNNTIPASLLEKLKPNLMEELQNSFELFLEFWPRDLPKGFIHADLFPDNVFFINDKITGVIDFYFSCTDILTYDLAIAINAWCFDKKHNFLEKNYQSLLSGYNSERKLSEDENFFLPLLCQAAALRFLLTRLFDWVHTPIEANVVPKNPEEYIIKHQYFKKLVNNVNYKENLL